MLNLLILLSKKYKMKVDMDNPTCGNESGDLQTTQNNLLAFNPTTQ